MIKSRENTLGAKVFLFGVILAVSIGVVMGLSTSGLFNFDVTHQQLNSYSSASFAILVILGIIVGISIGGKDLQTFLFAGTVIVLVSGVGLSSVRGSLIGIGVGDIASSVFGALSALFVPATIIVALKTVFSIAKI